MQGKKPRGQAPGNGDFQRIRQSGASYGEAEQGKLSASTPTQLSPDNPMGIASNRVSQLHHQFHARKSIVWGGRDD